MSPVPEFFDEQTPHSSKSTASSASGVMDGPAFPRILSLHGQNQFYRKIFASVNLPYPDSSRLGTYRIPKKCPALPSPTSTQFLWKQPAQSSNQVGDVENGDNKDYVLRSILTPYKVEVIDNSYYDSFPRISPTNSSQSHWSRESSFIRATIKQEVVSNVGSQSVFSFSQRNDANLAASVKQELLSTDSVSPSFSLGNRSQGSGSTVIITSRTHARHRYKFKSEQADEITISEDEEEQDDHKGNRCYGDKCIEWIGSCRNEAGGDRDGSSTSNHTLDKRSTVAFPNVVQKVKEESDSSPGSSSGYVSQSSCSNNVKNVKGSSVTVSNSRIAIVQEENRDPLCTDDDDDDDSDMLIVDISDMERNEFL